jgi:hypothetical protein
VKAIPGVAKIPDGYNPATWMLEVSNVEEEIQLGVDFADIYLKSSLYQYEPCNLFLPWICIYHCSEYVYHFLIMWSCFSLGEYLIINLGKLCCCCTDATKFL